MSFIVSSVFCNQNDNSDLMVGACVHVYNVIATSNITVTIFI